MNLEERRIHTDLLILHKPNKPRIPNDYVDYPTELKMILTSLARISDSVEALCERDTDGQFGMILDAVEQIPKDLAAVL